MQAHRLLESCNDVFQADLLPGIATPVPSHCEPEVLDDQVRHLGTFYQVQHPQEGEVWGINPPVFVDGKRPGPMRPPPVLGEHSKDILAELGLSGHEIAELKTAKVI